MTLGQAIKDLRLKKGMTQEELATKTDTKTRTIQRIENDEVSPRAYTVQRIAQALDVNFERLHHSGQDKENNKAELLLHNHFRQRRYSHLFLYMGILLLGTALGISSGVVLARLMKLQGETKEMIILGLIVWIGISCLFCYYLSRKQAKG